MLLGRQETGEGPGGGMGLSGWQASLTKLHAAYLIGMSFILRNPETPPSHRAFQPEIQLFQLVFLSFMLKSNPAASFLY